MKEFIEVNGVLLHKGFVPLSGYDNLYCINPFGEIVSPSNTDQSGHLRKCRILKPQKDRKGYLRIGLQLNGTRKYFFVHRLVAGTFLQKVVGKTQVNHKDGDKQNNYVGNLEWVTNQENVIHSYRNNLRKPTNHVGERNNMAKLKEQDIQRIKTSDMSVQELAELFGVSKSCIYKVKQHRRWIHVLI